jgi:hypothetical protein
MKTGTAVALGLGAAGAAYFLLKPKTAEASDDGTSTPPVVVDVPAANGQPTIEKRKGDLRIVLKLRVSSLEKIAANPGNILRDVLKGAKALAVTLPATCPSLVKLVGAPTGTIGGTSSGYAIIIAFPALWGARSSNKAGYGIGQPIKKEALDCITREIRKNKKINERFISLTATRGSANA